MPRYHILEADNEGGFLQNSKGEVLPIAHLDIGIKDLTPGQQLSLLFLMEEGTGNANFDPPEVRWSYLAKDENGISDVWLPFRNGAIFEDTTKSDPASKNSLLQSGLVKFTTSPRMTGERTRCMGKTSVVEKGHPDAGPHCPPPPGEAPFVVAQA